STANPPVSVASMTMTSMIRSSRPGDVTPCGKSCMRLGQRAQLAERRDTARDGPGEQNQEQLRRDLGVVHGVMAHVRAQAEVREPIVEGGVVQMRLRHQRRRELRQ